MSNNSCHCGRGLCLNGKGCCQRCYDEGCAEHESRVYNPRYHSQKLERIEAPMHQYSAAAAARIPSKRTTENTNAPTQ